MQPPALTRSLSSMLTLLFVGCAAMSVDEKDSMSTYIGPQDCAVFADITDGEPGAGRYLPGARCVLTKAEKASVDATCTPAKKEWEEKVKKAQADKDDATFSTLCAPANFPKGCARFSADKESCERTWVCFDTNFQPSVCR